MDWFCYDVFLGSLSIVLRKNYHYFIVIVLVNESSLFNIYTSLLKYLLFQISLLLLGTFIDVLWLGKNI